MAHNRVAHDLSNWYTCGVLNHSFVRLVCTVLPCCIGEPGNNVKILWDRDAGQAFCPKHVSLILDARRRMDLESSNLAWGIVEMDLLPSEPLQVAKP